MAIDQNGVYIPDTLQHIKNELEANQIIMGTKFHIYKDTVYQSMVNPIATAMYNLQFELASIPVLVSNECKMQNTYISRSPAITSDAIKNTAEESELIDYAQVFNTTNVAGIYLYIYKDGIDFANADLQFTADELAKITSVFVPYKVDANSELSKTYTSRVSDPSFRDVIFNIANVVTTSVNIVTVPSNIQNLAETLKSDFTKAFNEKQRIGVSFDEAFYQRELFVDGLSSMNFTATVTACQNFEILRLGEVTVNGV